MPSQLADRLAALAANGASLAEIRAAADAGLGEVHGRLQESEERFRALVEASFEGITVSIDGRIIEANRPFAAMLGYEIHEVLGLSPEDFTDAAPEILAHIRAGDEQPYLALLRGKEGRAVRVEVIGRNASWRGQAARVTGFRDVTARVEAEAALRASERRYREMADMLPVALAETDVTGRITFMNRAALELAGYPTLEEASQHRVHELMATADLDRMALNFQRRARGEDVGVNEYVLARADGSTFPGAVHGGLLRRDGHPAGIRAVIIDLSDRKRAEEERLRLEAQVLHAQKLESLGVLAGGIAHDFNNLLMAVLGNTDLAMASTPDASPAREALERIRKATQRASELTNQMLAYSGRASFARETFDVGALVEELANLLAVSLPKKARLRVELGAGPALVQGDPSQIRQVVMNLLTNAGDALGDAPGDVVLRVRRAAPEAANGREPWLAGDVGGREHVEIEVSDTGAGMDEVTRARIFEPFFTTKFAGRGLGLAAVLGIVRSHGGGIRVQSEPERGSRFSVRLPLAEGAAPSAEPRAMARVSRLSGTVLVADDEPAVLEVVAESLARAGITVLTARDGVEAVEVFGRDPGAIDLVLLDVTMPRMSGVEALRAMRAVEPGVRAILCSGWSEEEIRDRVDLAGVLGVLRKPYSLRALVAGVAEALRAASPRA